LSVWSSREYGGKHGNYSRMTLIMVHLNNSGDSIMGLHLWNNYEVIALTHSKPLSFTLIWSICHV
jgi:hypothetical protein